LVATTASQINYLESQRQRGRNGGEWISVAATPLWAAKMKQGTTELMARGGYTARGVVYMIVGGFAVLAAFGSGGATTGTRGALYSLLTQPFGYALLGAVALGLLCFSLWRLLQALLDADRLGTDWRAAMRRTGFAVSAAVNAALAVSAVALLLGLSSGAGDGEGSAKDWTAYFLSAPFGRWLVGAVGLIITGTGVGVGVKAWKGTFKERLALSGGARRRIMPMGRLGFFARAVVLLIVGGFLALAALHADPSEAKGLAGALRAIQAQPFGWLLFSITALGLFAFGAFQFVVAYYRRIDAPEPEAIGREIESRGRAAAQALRG
jgi:Domain of Unknown Function (DUF1206)